MYLGHSYSQGLMYVGGRGMNLSWGDRRTNLNMTMKARSSKYLQSVQSPGNLRPAQLIQFARKTQVYTQNYYFDLSNKRAVHLIIFEKNHTA